MKIPRTPARRRAGAATRALGPLLVVLALVSPALAQDPGQEGQRRHGHRRPGWLHEPEEMAERLQRKLELSDEQRTELRDRMQRFHDDHSALLEDLREMQEELRGRRRGREPGESLEGLDDLHERMEEHRRQLRPGLERLRAELDLLLTPEQRRRLDEMRDRGREHRKRWRERGPGGS